MQPKEDQIKFAPSPGKQKENLAKLTAIEQWDHLAFSVIFKELVPQGFKEIKQGGYKGLVTSNIPFLTKKSVTKCQNIAAQLVRSFRSKFKGNLTNYLEASKVGLQECDLWRLRRKWKLKGQIESIEAILQEIDNVDIK